MVKVIRTATSLHHRQESSKRTSIYIFRKIVEETISLSISQHSNQGAPLRFQDIIIIFIIIFSINTMSNPCANLSIVVNVLITINI